MSKVTLKGKVAVITGASSGIGRATALLLARQGAHLALAARNTPALEQLADQIRAGGGVAHIFTTDVTEKAQVKRLVGGTLERWGRVDILVSNAGQYIRSPVRELTDEVIRRSMEINFHSSVYAILAVLPHMLGQRSGHIVLVSTVDAKKGLMMDTPYVAAKSALSGFGEVLRQELHGSGIYVSTIFPGRVDTPLIENLRVPWISAKIPAEAVAKAILKAIQRRQREVILPFQAKLLIYLNVLSPRFGDLAARWLHLDGWEQGEV